MNIDIVCWHCGAGVIGEVERAPMFGFELAELAQEAGMVAYYDLKRGRVLVFCNNEHADAETTKTGDFRARARGVEIDQREHA